MSASPTPEIGNAYRFRDHRRRGHVLLLYIFNDSAFGMLGVIQGAVEKETDGRWDAYGEHETRKELDVDWGRPIRPEFTED